MEVRQEMSSVSAKSEILVADPLALALGSVHRPERGQRQGEF